MGDVRTELWTNWIPAQLLKAEGVRVAGVSTSSKLEESRKKGRHGKLGRGKAEGSGFGIRNPPKAGAFMKGM